MALVRGGQISRSLTRSTSQKPMSPASVARRRRSSRSASAASACLRSVRSNIAPIMRTGLPSPSRSTVPRSSTAA